MAPFADEPADYEFVSELVYRHSRIRLLGAHRALIRSRLAHRLRLRGFECLHEYCEFLRRQADDREVDEVVDALAMNFTGFLREPEHFEFMVRHAIPGLLRAGQGRFHVWSAACATGEEAYSAAFHLAEHYPLRARWDWRVYATDISAHALAHARAGVYRDDAVRGLPAGWVPRYFERGEGSAAGQFRVRDCVRQRVMFERANLVSGRRFDCEFEVILCRNVMIYFDRDTQQELVERLAGSLKHGGHLLIGQAESLSGLSTGLRYVRPSIYQKI
jgi:chemotaxis protein methyltransferase CheR